MVRERVELGRREREGGVREYGERKSGVRGWGEREKVE